MLWGLLLIFCLGAAAHEGTALRRPISPEQPAWIIHIDVWNYADPQKIIDMVPEDVRPFVIFNIATSTSDEKSANGPAIYDSWMKVCAQNRVWTMIQCASGYFNRMPDTPDDVSAYEKYYQEYPNFLGFNFAEQYWGFDGSGEGAVSFDNRLQLFAKLLSLAKTYGGYLAVSFADSYYNANKMPIAYTMRNASLGELMSSNSDNFLCFEKFTQKKNFLYNESNCLGAWLSGIAGQYGIRFDSSGWVASGDEPDRPASGAYTTGTSDFVRAAGAIAVAEHMMLTGQTMMDGPELTWRECSEETGETTVDGYTRRNWQWFPQFRGISLDLFRKILDGTIRIMTKDEVLSRTKVCATVDKNYRTPAALFDGLYRHANDYGGLNGTADNHWLNNRWWMKSTGRYPTIPTMTGGLTDISSYSKEQKVSLMNELFPEEYSGDIYAGRHENGWVTYNPYQYEDTNSGGVRTLSKSASRAVGTIPFRYNTCTSIELDYAPYSLGIMKEYNSQVTLYLSNYEGGEDIIKINGATVKPTYTKNDRGGSSSVSESWSGGVYTLTVQHSGGAVDLTINCQGTATGRETAYQTANISMPAAPEAYSGVLQYEAELADYKSATINKTGYGKGRDGYQGQGFAELTGSSSRLRFATSVPTSGNYLLTVRYQADADGSVTVEGKRLSTVQANTWTDVQTIVNLSEGSHQVTVENTGGKKTAVDCITLQRIKAETFSPDGNGEFRVNLGDLMAEGTISIDASTGVVTQSAGSSNASGSLTLYLDNADFSKVASLKVDYEGDGDIFKYLIISDINNNSVNPTGTQGAFWSSKYSLDYTNYQQSAASQQVSKIEWTANAPEATARTMTIKSIVIKTVGSAAIGSVSENIVPVTYYNLQGQLVGPPQHGVYLVKYSDGRIVKQRF